MPRSSLGVKVSQDELTETVLQVVQSLSQHRKADLLLDTALALIKGGQYVLILRCLLSF